ncbi:hypothetical protein GWK47_030286 [Chionoecetes opilio]|uniref:Uncharacterized protein n=1 Tax=Chionoecetes opilio TaxID=41210 RepID=A0A8J4YK56_CHIOP|nr:hypothetical protein GWK47_030286 [Chionoecetes opilio]
MLSKHIRIPVGGSLTTPSTRQNQSDSAGKGDVETSSAEVVGSCRAADWKDELKDIQAARVEQEVARLQRTIEETQRRWETYARHGPGRGATTLSDGSTEHLHQACRGGSSRVTQGREGERASSLCSMLIRDPCAELTSCCVFFSNVTLLLLL